MKNIPDFNLRYSKEDTPILKAVEIDNHASFILQEYSKSHPEYSFLNPQATPIENIIELYCGISMDYQLFAEENILGMTSFSEGCINIIRDGKTVPYKVEKGTIIISSELEADEKQEGRLNYTLAHELGHNVYHRRKFEEPDYSSQPSLFDEEPKEEFAITCHRDNIENPDNTQGRDWVEWQADYFASCFLMPKEAVTEFWKNYRKEPEFVFGEEPEPYLAEMPYNEFKTEFLRFVNTFKVSKKAAKIRLIKLNYITGGKAYDCL
ncbi:MAG: ImmA/IrrE family metallo-endopeptidase [Treponema sp.]|nr:ImmA/IrrE family metallo-endopeptidase [Treponema sp.]